MPRIDFSEMRDLAALEELDRLDRLVASLIILNASEDVLLEAKRDLEIQWEKVRDMYPEEADQFHIAQRLSGIDCY